MKPILKIVVIILVLSTFHCCSEIYNPVIDTDTEALVVEGLITDGDGPFTVKLTRAQPYSSDSAVTTTYVSDAILTVSDNEGGVYELTYQGDGEYALPTDFRAVVGRSYVVHIETSDGELYESDSQTLLPPETIDSLYTTVITKSYINDLDVLTNVEGYDVRVNLFHSVSDANPMPLCRFKSNVVVQYEYTYYDVDPETNLEYEWYWDVFGWRSFELDDNENITEERAKSSDPEIKNHFLCFIPKKTASYGFTTSSTAGIIYYYRLQQFTINEDTYSFYEEANDQLAATGKLFDPITSQLDGNMNCTSDPSRIVLGLFEVSSVTKAAFIVRTLPRAVSYIAIPENNSYQYKVYPDERETNDSDFIVIPYPSWWNHTN
jgi:hypothetical protein